MKGIDLDKLLKEKHVTILSTEEALRDVEPYQLSYEQKYKLVILKLRYAMNSYFEEIIDITDDEVVQTACDDLVMYFDSINKNPNK